jgi:hypothetical protein
MGEGYTFCRRGWALLALGASGCFLAGGEREYGEPPEPRDQWIAVGAQVELRITECQGGDGRLLHCVPSRVAGLGRVEVLADEGAPDAAAVFQVVETRGEQGDGYVVLRAVTEGNARLHLRYRDPSGETRESELGLHAVKAARVGVHALCGERQLPEPELLFGAESSFDVQLDPRSRENENLETGDLPLVDFGVFEVVQRHDGGRLTLRAPATAGAYAWTTLANERLEVRVFDASALAVVGVDAAPSQLRLTADPGGVACTAARDGLAEVRVQSGECQLGFSGLQITGALPLAVGLESAPFEVTGAGECSLAVLVAGSVVANHTLIPVPPVQTPPPGEAIGSVPVRFDLHDPLPSASCDRGVSDGKCEPLIWLIPDADCITDADFSVRHFDSRGPIGDDFVGTGLLTQVALGVVVGPGLLEGMRAPMDVSWDYDERLFGLLASKDDVHVEIGECMAPTGETRGVQIEVDAVGPHQIEFEASNINDTAELDFAARDVDRGRVEIRVDDASVRESEWPVFVGSSVTVSAHYERSDGLVLRGDAPLDAVSDLPDSGARIGSLGALFVGAEPHRLHVTPTVGSGGQLLEVVDAQSVASLRLGSMPAAVAVGEVVCLQVETLDEAARPIRGAGAVRLMAELLQSEALAWALDPSTTARQVCLRAVGSAASSLTLSLGQATLQQTLPLAVSPVAP